MPPAGSGPVNSADASFRLPPPLEPALKQLLRSSLVCEELIQIIRAQGTSDRATVVSLADSIPEFHEAAKARLKYGMHLHDNNLTSQSYYESFAEKLADGHLCAETLAHVISLAEEERQRSTKPALGFHAHDSNPTALYLIRLHFDGGTKRHVQQVATCADETAWRASPRRLDTSDVE